MSNFDFTNNEEALNNLKNQLKNAEQATQVEQTEPKFTSNSDVLADDLFVAQDTNGLSGTYKASELRFGTLVSIEGAKFFHTLYTHDNHIHSVWVDIMSRVLSDENLAELARNVENVTIIHFG